MNVKNLFFLIFVFFFITDSIKSQTETVKDKWENFQKTEDTTSVIFWNKKTGGIKRIIGSNIKLKSKVTTENISILTNNFINKHKGLFFTTNTDAVLLKSNQSNSKYSLCYQQYYKGIPVWNATLRFVIQKDYTISFIGSNFFNIPDQIVTPQISIDQAIANAKKEINITNDFKVTNQELVFLPDYNIERNKEIVLCWHFTLSPTELDKAKDFFIDVKTGKTILSFYSHINSEVNGTIQNKAWSKITSGSAPPIPDLTVPTTNLTVSLTGNTFSDTKNTNPINGQYNFNIPQIGQYTLESLLEGPHAFVINEIGERASHTAIINVQNDDPITHDWIWNNSNHYNEYNIFYYMNEAWRHFSSISGFNTNFCYSHSIECIANVPMDVNRDGVVDDNPNGACNIDGDYIYINSPGGPYGGLIYHEYAHNVIIHAVGSMIGHEINSDARAMDEGLADYFSCSFQNDPRFCYASVRRLDTEKKYYPPGEQGVPFDPSEAHMRGMIIGGACWDLRQTIGSSLVDELVYDVISTYIAHDDTFEDFMDYLLLADDNDGNIYNGMPHDNEIFDAFNNKHHVLGSYVSGTIHRDMTLSDDIIVLGDITIPAGITLTIENGHSIYFPSSIDIESGGSDPNNSEIILNGKLKIINGGRVITGCLTMNSGSEIEIGKFSYLELWDGGFIANGDVNISGSTNSHFILSSSSTSNSGTNITFGDNLIVDFNQNLTMNNGVNFSFGLNSVVYFRGLTTINTGSSCMFRDYATVEFFDDFHLYGILDPGNHSNFDFDDLAHFHRYCYKVPRIDTHMNYHGRVIVEGGYRGDIGSTDSFRKPAFFSDGADYRLGANTTASFADVCVIDSGATVNIDHANAFFNDSLLVFGKFWADNCTIDFGNDTTKAQGIIFEGGGASLSRITDSIVRDCVDGITIINSSPLIKTSEFFNIEKRGFNIIGIDAEPEIRQCYIHLTGTYPLQMLSEADPTLVDNRFYGNGKCGARIWGADGTFSRNEFRSNNESGVFVFSSSAQPQFYSFADSGGNMFDMSHIATQAIFIGGGNPMFGDYPNINGNNIFKNRGSRYYIYNDTPGNIIAELSWWANGTPASAFYNPDGGSVDFLPKLSSEPPAGPLLLKTAASPSPFNAGFEKYRQKDYAGAMQDLKQMLQQDKTSVKADQAVFRLGKAARKIGKLGELEAFLGDLKKEKDPQIQYHSRNWLCYLYASRNDMKKAERLLDEVPKGSSYERTLLLDICSYYASLKDMKNANRIAEILKERHNNDVLAMELEAALEGWIDFTQVKGQTKAHRRGASIPVPQPYIAEQTETPVPVDTVAFKAGIYPNPFNSSTTINYSVAQDGPVQIAIYDLLGRRVQTLVDECRATGLYRAVWNGCDNTGRSVASGIYFVRMQVGGKVQSFKISYVK